MAKIADAEKLTGHKYWTIYDGRGGVFAAFRNAGLRRWTAYQRNGTRVEFGKTLRAVRELIAADERKER